MRLLGRRLSRGCEVEWRRGLDSLVEEGKGEEGRGKERCMT
jgi:hypothetical protein